MPAVGVSLAEVEAEQERRRNGERLRDEAERLKLSLRAYVRAAWPAVEPATPLVSNWHIDAICDALEACYRRDIRRLIVNVPPRTMKSSLVSVLAPTWRWTTAPHERFLTASYGQSLATRDALKSRRLIQSSWYRARFGDVYQLTGDQNQKGRYENDRTGYRLATSVGGTGTGEGGDVIQIDDPHKADEIESDTEREAVLEWHDGTISTRFNDPEQGVEILIMQRLHEADLTGHLLDFGGWTHLCLPMRYEPSHPFVCPRELPTRGEPVSAECRTEAGELLFPSRLTAEVVDDLAKTLGAYRSAGQLQQRPAPAAGGIFKTAHWRYFDPANLTVWQLDPPMALCTFWDTAVKDKATSDFTVGATWLAIGANRYLVRLTRDRLSLTDTKIAVRAQVAWCEEIFPHVAHRVYVENTANGPDVIAQLRDKVPGLMPTSVQGDKTQRAHAVTPQLEAHQLYLPGAATADGLGFDAARTPAWVQEFVAEHASFPNGAHDDQVDTTTGVLLKMRGSYEASGSRHDDLRPKAISAGLRDRQF